MSEDYGDWQTRAGIEINEELLFETELNEDEVEEDNKKKKSEEETEQQPNRYY